jgi:hypothetical protein
VADGTSDINVGNLVPMLRVQGLARKTIRVAMAPAITKHATFPIGAAIMPIPPALTDVALASRTPARHFSQRSSTSTKSSHYFTTIPFYTPPRSHTDGLGTLKAAQAADAADFAAAHRMLRDVVDSRLGMIAVNEPVVFGVAAAEAPRAREVSEKDARRDDLLLHIRDSWEGLKRRSRRKKHDASVLPVAGPPLAGNGPPIPHEMATVSFAKQILKGDADMLPAGFPAMANPTAAEVDAMRIAYENGQNDVAPADRDFDAALPTAANHVANVDDIIEDARAAGQLRQRSRRTPECIAK